MLVKCPNNPDHKRFVATAHMLEEWITDEHGNWLETVETLDVVSKPTPEDLWLCETCNEQAEVTP